MGRKLVLVTGRARDTGVEIEPCAIMIFNLSTDRQALLGPVIANRQASSANFIGNVSQLQGTRARCDIIDLGYTTNEQE
jgi:hypothetical protein